MSVPEGCPDVEMTKEDEIFLDGLNAGMMMLYEGQVTDSFTAWQVLEKVAGADAYKHLLVERLNGGLFALSFVDRDVKRRPQALKVIVHIAPSSMKRVMGDIKRARIANQWQVSDAEREDRIMWVLERYIAFGNIYGSECGPTMKCS
jgi:hypothetical protein